MKKVLALLLGLMMVLGMMGTVAAEDVVTLKWVTVGSGMPANYDSWAAQLNSYLAEKIGVNIEMEVISWGDWDNRRNTIVNTNEPYDIIFGNDGTYVNDVTLGAYMEITQEMLEENAPGLLELIPAGYWDACRVNGAIYAVPTYKDSSMSQYFVWDKDLLDANNLDASNAHTLEDIEPILNTLKDKTAESVFPLTSGGASWLLANYDSFSSGLPAVSVRHDDKELKVVATLEQADIMEDLKILHKWYNEGLINSDAATKAETNKYAVCSVAQGWPYAAISTWGPNMGVNAAAYQLGETLVSNGTVQGSLNSISINCENPEKALQFLNLVNTDAYVRDSFYYGEQGYNWDYTEEGRLTKHNSEWTMAGYTQGTFFKVTQLDTDPVNQWDEVKALNEAAVPSVLLGFFFDNSEVQDELASCIEIFNRYRGEILTGTTDPEVSVPQMMQEMRDAGFDAIVDAAQEQINEWAGK